MKIRFVCQEPRWDLTDDVHLEPPRCGNWSIISVEPLQWEEGRVAAKCPMCRYTTYPDVSAFEVLDHEMPVAVGVLGLNDGRVLGVSRKNDHTAFGVPGGKVDPRDGELTPLAFTATLRRAAVREFREETGITLEPEQLDFFYQGVCPGGADGIAYWMVTLKVRDGVVLNPVTQPGEGLAKWVSWATLLGGPFGDYNSRLQRELGGGVLNPPLQTHFKVEPMSSLCGDDRNTITTIEVDEVDCPECASLLNLEAEREYMATRIYDSLGIPQENREP